MESWWPRGIAWPSWKRTRRFTPAHQSGLYRFVSVHFDRPAAVLAGVTNWCQADGMCD
jgi:hypothetical protein